MSKNEVAQTYSRQALEDAMRMMIGDMSNIVLMSVRSTIDNTWERDEKLMRSLFGSTFSRALFEMIDEEYAKRQAYSSAPFSAVRS